MTDRFTVNIGEISLPTLEHAIAQGEEYCRNLYETVGTLTGLMDLAGNGGTEVWWKLSDMTDKLAEHLGLED